MSAETLEESLKLFKPLEQRLDDEAEVMRTPGPARQKVQPAVSAEKKG